MVKHNNVVPNAHFNKQWQERIHVTLEQPMRKKRRRMARKAKAARVAPRPTQLLRPVVHCPTQRYNMRVRYGRGFTFEELRSAKINPKVARSIGIAVDHRRTNKSTQSHDANVKRLQTYMEKLVVFPTRGNAFKKGKVGQLTSAEDACKAVEGSSTQDLAAAVPLSANASEKVRFARITQALVDAPIFETLRKERIHAKRRGQLDRRLELRKKKEAEASKSKKKKKKKGKK